jgi:hypothetical protein
MRLEINDFLVRSILQAFRIVLPARIYENLTQDYLEILMKCNIELARLSGTGNRSEKVDAILTAD